MLGQENPWTWLTEGMDTRVLECFLGRDREGSIQTLLQCLVHQRLWAGRLENTPGFTGIELMATFLSLPLTLGPHR